MEKKDFNQLSNEELLVEKKKLQQSKTFHALWIGFLAGIFLFGVVGWILAPKQNLGFLIPISIPVIFIYRILKSPINNQELEKVLQERNLV